MLKIFNRKHEQVDIIENPISPIVLDTLNTIGEFTFSLPTKQSNTLELEGYVQIEFGAEYVIKEKVKHGKNTEVTCMLNLEEIVGMARVTFTSKENTVYDTARLILSGTGWRIDNKSTRTETRNLYGKITNAYNLLNLMCTVFDVEVMYNTYDKVVTIVDRLGEDRGTYFISDLNLKRVTHDTHSHKYITRVIPIGKDGLTIESVNGGKDYLLNNSYTNKEIYGIWQSDKHDDPQKLKDDAQRFLDEMAVPYETYEVSVEDLYKLRGNSVFKYSVGDIVTIIDAETETRIEQRIIQREYDLLNPTNDTIRIANRFMTFQDYYKRLQTIADMTESILQSDGTINKDSIPDLDLDFELDFDSITADHIKAESIQTKHLVADSITAEKIVADSIDTKHLKADSITAEHIQTGAITAGSGVIADGAIGNAQIANLDAGKINAGKVNTSLVQVQSESGNLDISDNTIQIRDDKGQTRVQIGKDAREDYNMYVFDDNGFVMFDATGITSEGIKSPIIRDDMISDTAHINGAKINIDSVITEINDNGTTDLTTSKLVFDDTGQKFNTTFKKLTTQVDEQGKEFTDFKATEFKVEQGKIETLIQDTTIVTEDGEYKIKDAFSKLEQTTEEITTTVGSKVDKDSVISTINQTAEAVTINANKVNLNGYVTINSLGTAGSTTIHGGNIKTGTVTANQIASNTITANEIKGKTLEGVSVVTRTTGNKAILTESGVRFYGNNGNTQCGEISYDSTGAGTAEEARDRLWLRSSNNYALKIQSAGDMSISPATGKKVWMRDVHVNGTLSADNFNYNPSSLNLNSLSVSGSTTLNSLTTNGTTNSKLINTTEISVSSGNVTVSRNGFWGNAGTQVSVEKVYADAHYHRNGYVAFAKAPYNNNMNNGSHWDWQGYNLVGAKIYTRMYNYPTSQRLTKDISEPNLEGVLDSIDVYTTIRDNQSKIDIDISKLKSLKTKDLFINEQTTGDSVDMVSMLHLALYEIKQLKKEIEELKQK